MHLFVGLVSSIAAIGAIPDRDKSGLPHLRSETALIRFADTEETLIAKNPDKVRPIASITKLMTALLLEKRTSAVTSTGANTGANAGTNTSTDTGAEASSDDGADLVTISNEDKDTLKWSKSRLRVGRSFLRSKLLEAGLVASDNRAMYAIVRSFGIERSVFAAQMNTAARDLGMRNTTFRDPAGIDPGNVSTARDLMILLGAAVANEQVRKTTLLAEVTLADADRRELRLTNPNRLVRSRTWEVLVGKTGYTTEAGRNLVLRAMIGGRPVDIVLLGAREMASVFGDAGRVRRWLLQRMGATASTR